MQELMKVSEISSRYGVSTRALRYYEEMGLIQSCRTDEYAYRMYDTQAQNRLEQILILRKLNISIKDIQTIFSSSTSKTVLDILAKKTKDIDDEISLLHEFKQVVLAFIHQIKQSDFHDQDDISQLYQKAREIEKTLLISGYDGSSGQTVDLNDMSRRIRKMLSVRVVSLPSTFVGLYKDYDTLPAYLKKTNEAFYPTKWTRFNRHICDVEDFIVLPQNYTEDASFKVEPLAGGLYAVGILQGDTEWGIETDASLLYRWAGDNDFLFREDAHMMWNSLPAQGSQPPLIEMYVPVIQKDQPAQIAVYENAEALFSKIRTKRSVRVDLQTLVCKAPAISTINGGELSIYNDGNDAGGLFTKEKYSFPLMIKLRAKTDSTNIRLNYGKGGLVFNWGIAVDSLIGRDITDSSFFHHEPGGHIPVNEYADIIWILQSDYMAVVVDGKVRMYRTDMPFTQSGASTNISDHVMINAAFQSTVTVAELEICEI